MSTGASAGMDATEFARAISPWPGGSGRHLTSQLTLAIRHAISSGLLRPSDRLPPERALAEALNVSRPTVSAVMHELRTGGLVASRQGSGSWIRESSQPVTSPIPFFELIQQPGLIDLAAATAPDAAILDGIRIEGADLLAADPANGLSPTGLHDLRESIAARLRTWTPSIGAGDVIVTSGAHQALALLVATLVPRGATVLVEDVTYGGLIDIIETNGARVVGIERDAEGPRPDSLRSLIERHQPALTILVSSVHSPTGTIASEQRNADLAAVLSSTDGHIAIDETYADLEFRPSARTLTAALGGRAILVSSLSKSARLGLRTGWVAAPTSELVTSLARQRWSRFDLGQPIPSQLVALEVLRRFDGMVADRRAVLVERSSWLTETLADAFPDWEITPAAGGLAMWIRLPGADSTRFVARAAERGIAVLPGSACRADRGIDPHIRVCFDRSIATLEEAVARLTGA
ncbi:MAG: PLP-dependent aminotransferase family protein [Acidimicrobiales bacterium]